MIAAYPALGGYLLRRRQLCHEDVAPGQRSLVVTERQVRNGCAQRSEDSGPERNIPLDRLPRRHHRRTVVAKTPVELAEAAVAIGKEHQTNIENAASYERAA